MKPTVGRVRIGLLSVMAVVGCWWAVFEEARSEPAPLVPPREAPGQAFDPEAFATNLAARQFAGRFHPSLVMKESVDFLLAPVFLVQEAISGKAGSQSAELPADGWRIQFDSIVTLKPVGSGRLMELHVRYWVSARDYHVAIVWMEPHGRGARLSFYAPTVRISSDEAGFSVKSDIHEDYHQSHPKPVAPQQFFTAQYGSYPVGEMRFAELEWPATRGPSPTLEDAKDVRIERVRFDECPDGTEPAVGGSGGIGEVLPGVPGPPEGASSFQHDSVGRLYGG